MVLTIENSVMITVNYNYKLPLPQYCYQYSLLVVHILIFWLLESYNNTTLLISGWCNYKIKQFNVAPIIMIILVYVHVIELNNIKTAIIH